VINAGAPSGFRTPPHNIDAEQALLGAMLINNEAYRRVAGFLRPEHFYEPVHGRVYAAMERLIGQGKIADPIKLQRAVADDEALRELDGAQYLARMARAAETVLNAEDYAAHIVELAAKRGLIRLCTEAVDEAHDPRDGRELYELHQSLVQGLDQIAREVKPKTEPLGVIDPAAWQGKPVPEREWAVEKWIPKRRITSLYGDGATGKSTLVQQLGTCVAVRRGWLGLPTIEGRVLVVFCEDDEDELHRRQESINRHYGIEYADLRGKLRFIERVGRDNLLMAFATGDVGHLTPFFVQLEAECQRLDPDLIALDPVADLFGGQESNRVHVRQFIQGCFGKLIRGCPRPATGILLAHPSKTGMADGSGGSGSTDWNNGVRSRLLLERTRVEKDEAPDEDARMLSRRKSNYARQGDQLSLRWRDDVFMLDAKVHAIDPGYLGHIERDRCEAVYLELLGTIIEQGRYLSPSRNSQNYGPALLAKSPDRAGFKRRDFELAQERLFREGRLTLGVHTTANRKKFDCILPKGAEGG
jgi:RecA-family ATPase